MARLAAFVAALALVAGATRAQTPNQLPINPTPAGTDSYACQPASGQTGKCSANQIVAAGAPNLGVGTVPATALTGTLSSGLLPAPAGVWADSCPGVAGNGLTDDKTALQSCMDVLGTPGGKLYLNPGKVYYVSALSVPASVTIDGGMLRPDNPGGSNFNIDYGQLGGIAVSSSGTISLGANAGLSNVFIKRAGMTFPVANASAYAGTAITFTADSPQLHNVLAVGFNTLVAETNASSQISRYVIDGFYGDGINGLNLSLSSYDSSTIRDCHLWPFAGANLTTQAALTRTGTGVYASGAQPDTRLDNCTVFGYQIGFDLAGQGGMTIGKIWADNLASYSAGTISATNGSAAITGAGTTWTTSGLGAGMLMNVQGVTYTIYSINSDTSITLTSPFAGTTFTNQSYTTAYTNSIGVRFDSGASETSADQIWSWSSYQGVVFNHGSGANIRIGDLYLNQIAGDAITVQSGNIHVSQSDIASAGGWAINDQSAASYIYFRGSAESIGQASTNGVIAVPSGADCNNIDVQLDSQALPAGTYLFGANACTPTSLASGASLNLPVFSTNFTITGTTNVVNIIGGYGGRKISLRFSGALTMTSGTGNVTLATGAFTTYAGSWLNLVYDSNLGQWIETSRGPNPAALAEYSAGSVGTLAANSTNYLGSSGSSATEANVRWVAARTFAYAKVVCSVAVAPGAGQSYTYTLMDNGSATSVTGAISGGATFGATFSGVYTMFTGHVFDVRAVTSSGAAVSTHSCGVELQG
jgi:hypothetical protein